jgi:uncharacterized protein (DUF488 family)
MNTDKSNINRYTQRVQLFTIGYEGLNAPDFFEILQANSVEVLIDVRAVALSRKTGFSKNALAEHCHEAGLEYQHWIELGCPSNIRDAYKESGDWTAYKRRFKRHLPAKDEVLHDLATLSEQKVCALMCFEADPRFCHRYFVAERIQKQILPELSIIHLTRNSTPSAAHSLALAGK